MTNYHVTPDGPKVCKAKVRNCPIGGEHFNDLQLAQEGFENRYSTPLTSLKKESVKSIDNLSLKAMGGGSYFGSEVPLEEIKGFRDKWRTELGDGYEELEAAKAKRDRGYKYHLTLVSPPEKRQLGRELGEIDSFSIGVKGIGKAVDGDNEAWFLVCDSKEVQDWRASQGLPKKDLHITLGFRNRDVHTVVKDESTIVFNV